MTETAIDVTRLDHFFGEGEARKQALFDVSISIARGSLTVLMGPSGSGKTTLLTLMGCLREVHAGSVRLLDQELFASDEAARVDMRRRLGFIFQAHNLHDSLTARQNVMMGLQVHGRGDRDRQAAAADHALRLVGLGHRLDYRPGNLSGGQKQRVAIARALVSNPEIIFADEPTAALDKVSGLAAVQLFRALGRARATTTVMVTHDPRIVDLADRVVTLEDGRLVRDQTRGASASDRPSALS